MSQYNVHIATPLCVIDCVDTRAASVFPERKNNEENMNIDDEMTRFSIVSDVNFDSFGQSTEIIYSFLLLLFLWIN